MRLNVLAFGNNRFGEDATLYESLNDDPEGTFQSIGMPPAAERNWRWELEWESANALEQDRDLPEVAKYAIRAAPSEPTPELEPYERWYDSSSTWAYVRLIDRLIATEAERAHNVATLTWEFAHYRRQVAEQVGREYELLGSVGRLTPEQADERPVEMTEKHARVVVASVQVVDEGIVTATASRDQISKAVASKLGWDPEGNGKRTGYSPKSVVELASEMGAYRGKGSRGRPKDDVVEGEAAYYVEHMRGLYPRALVLLNGASQPRANPPNPPESDAE